MCAGGEVLYGGGSEDKNEVQSQNEVPITLVLVGEDVQLLCKSSVFTLEM